MPTAFDVQANLTGNAGSFERTVSKAFGRVERRGAKASDSLTKRFARVAVKASKVGAAAFVGAGTAGFKDALALSRVMGDIQIQAGSTDDAMSELQHAIEQTSNATGRSSVQLAQASKGLVDLLGPVEKLAELQDLLARTSVASGADVGELSGLISAMSDSLGIATDDVEGMERGLSAFLSAGKVGKVPLEQMAVVLQDVASTFSEVSEGGVQGAADLASALQVARKSFGSAAKAGTGLEAFIGSLVQNAARLKKLKVEVFTGKGSEKRLRSFRDILDQIQERGLNVEQLTKALGRKEAAKFAKALTSSEGRQEFERIAAAAANADDVNRDFVKRTESGAFKISAAWTRMREEFSRAFDANSIDNFASALNALKPIIDELGDGIALIGRAVANWGKLINAIERRRQQAKEAKRIKQSTKNLAEIERLQEAAGTAFRREGDGLFGELDPEALDAARASLEEERRRTSAVPGVSPARAEVQARAAISSEERAILDLADKTFQVGEETVKGARVARTSFARTDLEKAAETSEDAALALSLERDIERGRTQEFVAKREAESPEVRAFAAGFTKLLRALDENTRATAKNTEKRDPTTLGGMRGGGRRTPMLDGGSR